MRACVNGSETGALELRVSALRRPASGDERGPRGGAAGCSGRRVPGSGRSPVPRAPPLQVAPAPPPPPPERPSARGPDTRSARRDPRRGAARASASPVRSWGREGEPDGWAEAAPPPSVELVGAKLWKQKDSNYLSGAGAGSSAVRLPGAGRVFSSRKAGGARELSPPSCCPGASAASVSRLARSGLG